MTDYVDLIQKLRNCATEAAPCKTCGLVGDSSCSDYLMKQAADAIEELQQTVEHYKGCSDDWYKEACDYKAMLPRWIPVAERLPESVCKSYLCLTDTGYHCEVRWTNNVYGLWKSDNEWGWSIADVPQYCKVTHWMPLPEPPKEE